MNAFKRNSLYAAVVAGLGTAASMNAGAVNLGTDGTGQVLLYPYYTVRNGFVTSFSVVNTSTAHTTVAKVRFLEGKNSAEVLDFNLWLSPRDVWTATVVDNGTGGAVFSTDNSCTAPALGKTAATANAFVNYYYTGQVAGTINDNGGAGLDRTREGYIEVIEMGVPRNAADAASSPSSATGIVLATAVKHGPTGVPAACATVQVNTLFDATDMNIPAGGLTGNYIVIGAATGTEFAHTPIAVENFQSAPTGSQIYRIPGDLNPQLTAVAPDRSDVILNTATGPVVTTVASWVGATGQAVDAVSAILMRSSIMNEFDTSTGFKTDVVITQPTKRFYVASATTAAAAAAPIAAVGPYVNTFASATPGGAQACDPVFPQVYDREEAPYTQTVGITFSPIPIGAPAGVGNICWEATVMTVVPPGGTVAGSSVFGSANSANVGQSSAAGSSNGFASGWVALFPTTTNVTAGNPTPGNSSGQTAGGGGATPVTITNNAFGGLRNLVAGGNRYRGLPVIGFAATQAIQGGQGYGGIFDDKFTRNIAP